MSIKIYRLNSDNKKNVHEFSGLKSDIDKFKKSSRCFFFALAGFSWQRSIPYFADTMLALAVVRIKYVPHVEVLHNFGTSKKVLCLAEDYF